MTPARHGSPTPPRSRPVPRRWPPPGPRTGALARSGRPATLRCRWTAAWPPGGAGCPWSGGWSAPGAGCRGLPRRVPPTDSSGPGCSTRSLRRPRSRSRRRYGGPASGSRWPPRPGRRRAAPSPGWSGQCPLRTGGPPRGSVPANAGTDREPRPSVPAKDTRRQGCSRTAPHLPGRRSHAGSRATARCDRCLRDRRYCPARRRGCSESTPRPDGSPRAARCPGRYDWSRCSLPSCRGC